MTIDHAPRIRAQQQQAAEDAAIKELENRTAPLFFAVYLAAAAAVFGPAVDGLGQWAAHYADMAAQNEAMVQCLNGRAISMGGEAVLHCEVVQYKLVGG